MPISALDPRALARLTPQQIADMVLQLDQDRRRYLQHGNLVDAVACDNEIDRLAKVFQAA